MIQFSHTEALRFAREDMALPFERTEQIATIAHKDVAFGVELDRITAAFERLGLAGLVGGKAKTDFWNDSFETL